MLIMIASPLNVSSYCRYNVTSEMFPWPVKLEGSTKFNKVINASPLNEQVKLELLHPFGQLQSTMRDARNLNVILNHPFGAR